MRVKKLTVEGESTFVGKLIVSSAITGFCLAKSENFNKVNGETIIPHALGVPDNYAVTLTPTTASGSTGEWCVTKGIDQVVVKNTGEDQTATFELLLFKIK